MTNEHMVTNELTAYALIPAAPLGVVSVILATKAHTAAARDNDSLSMNLADAGFLFGAPAVFVCAGLALFSAVSPKGFH